MRHEVRYTASIDIAVPDGVVALTPSWTGGSVLRVLVTSEVSAEDAAEGIQRFVRATLDAVSR